MKSEKPGFGWDGMLAGATVEANRLANTLLLELPLLLELQLVLLPQLPFNPAVTIGPGGDGVGSSKTWVGFSGNFVTAKTGKKRRHPH